MKVRMQWILAATFVGGCGNVQQIAREEGIDQLQGVTGEYTDQMRERCRRLLEQVGDRTGDVDAVELADRLGFDVTPEFLERCREQEQAGGQVMGQSLVTFWTATPENVAQYVLEVFQKTYFFGGYNIQYQPYEAGDYTAWAGTSLPLGDEFERAFLQRNEDGSEWWRLTIRDTDDGGREGEMVVEALLSPAQGGGARTIQRMRVKLPTTGETIHDVAPGEGSTGWTASPSDNLEQTQFGGLTDRHESLVTDSSAYYARVIDVPGEGGMLTLWLFDEVPLGREPVPGGVVQQRWTGSDGQGWALVLTGFGGDATTLLGSY